MTLGWGGSDAGMGKHRQTPQVCQVLAHLILDEHIMAQEKADKGKHPGVSSVSSILCYLGREIKIIIT